MFFWTWGVPRWGVNMCSPMSWECNTACSLTKSRVAENAWGCSHFGSFDTYLKFTLLNLCWIIWMYAIPTIDVLALAMLVADETRAETVLSWLPSFGFLATTTAWQGWRTSTPARTVPKPFVKHLTGLVASWRFRRPTWNFGANPCGSTGFQPQLFSENHPMW